jgi:hypothetical protein
MAGSCVGCLPCCRVHRFGPSGCRKRPSCCPSAARRARGPGPRGLESRGSREAGGTSPGGRASSLVVNQPGCRTRAEGWRGPGPCRRQAGRRGYAGRLDHTADRMHMQRGQDYGPTGNPCLHDQTWGTRETRLGGAGGAGVAWPGARGPSRVRTQVPVCRRA